MLALIFAAMAAAGFVAIYLGRRGTRIDDHPTCRSCRYDLFGAPPGQQKCPECGADVTQKPAIRHGNFRRRPAFTWTGLLVATAASLALIWTAFISLTDWNYFPYLPLRTLTWEIHRPDPAQSRAFAELERRASSASPAGVQWIVDRALDAQADVKTPWDTRWGKIVESAAAAGKIRPDQWQHYILNAYPAEFLVRPDIRRGDPLPYGFTCSEHAYFGPKFIAAAPINYYLRATVTADGATFKTDFKFLYIAVGHNYPTGYRDREYLFPPSFSASLTPGPHTLNLELEEYTTGTITASRSWTQTLTLNVLPESTPIIRLNTDPALRKAVQSAISISAKMDPDNLHSTHAGKYLPTLVLRVASAALPIDTCFKISIIDDGKELTSSHLTLRAGKTENWECDFPDINDNLTGHKITILLHPDPDYATRTFDIHQIWGEDLTFPNIPVTGK